MQKLTRPLRKPKKVPVTVVEVEEEDDEEEEVVEMVSESEEDEGLDSWKPQHGTMHSTRERKERRKRTSLVQSTEVDVSMMWIGPLPLPRSIILIVEMEGEFEGRK